MFRLPKILVIHLKRFTYGKWKKDKIIGDVEFGQNIDLSRFLHKDSTAKSTSY